MSSTVEDVRVTPPFAPAHAVVDELLAADLPLWTQGELLDAWRDLERVRNRLAAVEHRFVAEAERLGLPQEHGAKNTPAFVRGLLRVDGHEATARVRAAEAAVARLTVTGEPIPARFPQVAAAQAAGDISPKHAGVVVGAVTGLAVELQAEHGEPVERDLVGYAAQFDPHQLGRLAHRMTTLIDQDGTLDEARKRERDRGLHVYERPDGSCTGRFDGTAEFTARLRCFLDAQAKPLPEQDGRKDPRTAAQRNHDALMDAFELLARAELLPDTNGVSATVIVTTTESEWTSRTGVATTGHGAVLAVPDAIRLAGGDARLITVTLDRFGAITDWTDARRLFTECQRLAMTARDGGCTFPGCDAPPAWCQAAHIVDWIDGGPTTVDNGMLLCGHHHRNYEKLGWRPVSLDAHPAWIPPPWIDPDQQPRTNVHHRLH